jgi:hypothetical protein
MKIFLRALAFVCQVCPFCIVARRYPKSPFALVMEKLEKFCPFCRAYREVQLKVSGKE